MAFLLKISGSITDKEKEKQSIETIVTSIASDTIQLNSIIAGMTKLIDVTYTVNSFGSKTFNSEVYGGYKAPEGEELFFNYDKKTVNKIFNDACISTLNTEVYIGSLNQQLVYGKKLIGLLKKEYHLD